MKFNKVPEVAKELCEREDSTTNYEGALAFKLDPLTELYLKAASTLVGEPKFYTDAKTSDSDLLKSIHAVAKIDPEFILQLAVYCREKLYLRSVPLMLVAEFANDPNCVGKVENARKYVERIIQRADELTELIAYQLARNKVSPRDKTKLPMLIRFGVKNAFPKFDRYQIGKYNKDDAAVKMRDAMFLTHPEPESEEQVDIYAKLASKTLESPETWEVMRSTGQMTWHDVIRNVFYKNHRVNNYMAILRNLRNCLQSPDVTKEDVELLCRMISDQNAVRYSKQLPFRFFSAYKELRKAGEGSFTAVGNMYTNDVMDAIETAVGYSVDNFPKLSGTSTVIACDVSGSMEKEISKHSSVERFDIGIVLGMIANRFCGHTITGMFGDDWKVVPMTKSSGILRNALEMHDREGEVGYSTNGYKVIEYLLENDIKVDRIMIFTDCQMWDSEGSGRVRHRYSLFGGRGDDVSFAERFYQYQRKYPGVKLYCFDLSGYGNIMIPQGTKNVCLIGGWSDRVFDFISAFEEIGDKNTPIKKIKEIKPEKSEKS
jgi:60 kDa SS-A/Ro ribonucleoprotein